MQWTAGFRSSLIPAAIAPPPLTGIVGLLEHVSGKSIMRWLAVAVATPVGGFCGMVVADCLCRFALGGLNAHGDIATVLGAEALGILIGALLVPFCVWYFTRQVRS